MRGKSHICLGRYLVAHYLDGVSPICTNAFLLGCIEPDRNPITYLKGSLRCQWLRGHNYRNARRYMKNLSWQLEQKKNWNVYDYYRLGKLIHYTTDAFTYAHNVDFPTQLKDHQQYEAALQNYFLEFMAEEPSVDPMITRGIMNAICSYHRDYEQTESNIHNDAIFALTACCCVLAILFPRSIL